MRGIAGRVLLVSFLLFPLTGLSLADQWDEAGEQLCKVTVPGRGNPNSPQAPAAAQQFLNQFPFNAQNAARPNAEVYYAAAYLPQIFPAYLSRDYQRGYELYKEYLSFFSQNVLAREGRMVEMVGVKCLLGLNPGPEQALAVAEAASQRMLFSQETLMRMRNERMYCLGEYEADYASDLVRLYQIAGQPEKGWEFLRQMPIYHPDLLDEEVWWEPVILTYLEAGKNQRALEAAVMWFRTCRFEEKTVSNALQLILRVFLLSQQTGKMDAALAYLQTGEGDNPLAEVAMPKLTDEEMELAGIRSGGGTFKWLSIYLYAGKYEAAVEIALQQLANPQYDPTQALADIACCLKARDGHLARANQYVRYLHTGEGINPLEDF